MKISELISELEVLWAEHGDQVVTYTNECCCYGDHEVDPNPRLVDLAGYAPYVSL